MGETVPEVLSIQTEGTVSPNTDRPRSVNNIIQLRFKSVRKIFLYVEVGRICVDEAGGRLQTKTKHYNMTLSLVIYIMALTALF